MNYIDAVTKLVIEKLNEPLEDNRQRYNEDVILFDNLYALDQYVCEKILERRINDPTTFNLTNSLSSPGDQIEHLRQLYYQVSNNIPIALYPHLEAKQELEKVNTRATSVINNLPFIVPEFILSSTRTNIGLEKDFFSSGNFGLQQLRIIYASSGDEGVKALVSECLNGKNFASQSYSYIESTEWSEDTKNGLKEILKLKNFGITVNDGQKPPQQDSKFLTSDNMKQSFLQRQYKYTLKAINRQNGFERKRELQVLNTYNCWLCHRLLLQTSIKQLAWSLITKNKQEFNILSTEYNKIQSAQDQVNLAISKLEQTRSQVLKELEKRQGKVQGNFHMSRKPRASKEKVDEQLGIIQNLTDVFMNSQELAKVQLAGEAEEKLLLEEVQEIFAEEEREKEIERQAEAYVEGKLPRQKGPSPHKSSKGQPYMYSEGYPEEEIKQDQIKQEQFNAPLVLAKQEEQQITTPKDQVDEPMVPPTEEPLITPRGKRRRPDFERDHEFQPDKGLKRGPEDIRQV